MRIQVDEASDDMWKFAIALNKRPGLLWAECSFRCRTCGNINFKITFLNIFYNPMFNAFFCAWS